MRNKKSYAEEANLSLAKSLSLEEIEQQKQLLRSWRDDVISGRPIHVDDVNSGSLIKDLLLRFFRPKLQKEIESVELQTVLSSREYVLTCSQDRDSCALAMMDAYNQLQVSSTFVMVDNIIAESLKASKISREESLLEAERHLAKMASNHIHSMSEELNADFDRRKGGRLEKSDDELLDELHEEYQYVVSRVKRKVRQIVQQIEDRMELDPLRKIEKIY